MSADELVVYFGQIGAALDKVHGHIDKERPEDRPIVSPRPQAREPVPHAPLERRALREDIWISASPRSPANRQRTAFRSRARPSSCRTSRRSPVQVTPAADVWALWARRYYYLLTGTCYWRSANMNEPTLTSLFGEVYSLPFDPPVGACGRAGMQSGAERRVRRVVRSMRQPIGRGALRDRRPRASRRWAWRCWANRAVQQAPPK